MSELAVLPKFSGLRPIVQAAYVMTLLCDQYSLQPALPYSGPSFHSDPLDFCRSDLPSVEGFCIPWLECLD